MVKTPHISWLPGVSLVEWSKWGYTLRRLFRFLRYRVSGKDGRNASVGEIASEEENRRIPQFTLQVDRIEMSSGSAVQKRTEGETQECSPHCH